LDSTVGTPDYIAPEVFQAFGAPRENLLEKNPLNPDKTNNKTYF